VVHPVFRHAVSTLFLVCVMIVLWPPILTLLVIIYLIRDDEPILVQPARERRVFLLSLAPIGYFLVFAVVNLLTGWIG
jgi:hypothetical protein